MQGSFRNDPAPRLQGLREHFCFEAWSFRAPTAPHSSRLLTSEERGDAGSHAKRQGPQKRTGESPSGNFSLPTAQPPDEENKAQSVVEREQSQEPELRTGILRPQPGSSFLPGSSVWGG